MKTPSWVIVEISTGKAVFETYQESITRKINSKKYKAIPILEYLRNLNTKIILP